MKIKGNFNDWQTRFRLWAAIIMATYAIGYNIYYVLGLFSIEVMEGYTKIIYNLWILFWIIPFVILTHALLGLWKLYKRNTFKMPNWEKAQIILGLSIPFFLLPHIIYSYGLFLFFGVKINYLDTLVSTYPHFIWQYILMTLAIWIHAQIGVHVVLRMRRGYPKIKFIIITIFTLMPILGIAGYLKAGLEINGLDYMQKEVLTFASNEQLNIMKTISYSVYIVFPLIYILVLVSRVIRINKMNKNKNIHVFYSDGRNVPVFPKTTILEASRIGDVPHASICGGRGRCTTCRVKIENGMNNLSSIGEREQNALKKIDAKENVRLACQAECIKDEITVTLLLPPDIKSVKARKETKFSVGTEVNLVVMFVDLRGFTRLSEEKFPYDIVFILNRYFNFMGEVIENNGGTIDKFIGDGIMSFFGLKIDPQTACKMALLTAKQMAEKLIEINKQLKNVINEPLEIGIGLHYGNVILGELGYKEKSSLTIIGDTVNTASRLESLNKQTHSQMIFSSKLAEIAKIDITNLKKMNATIRGKKESLEILIVDNIVKELKEIQ